jgi:hypothetical protein
MKRWGLNILLGWEFGDFRNKGMVGGFLGVREGRWVVRWFRRFCGYWFIVYCYSWRGKMIGN